MKKCYIQKSHEDTTNISIFEQLLNMTKENLSKNIFFTNQLLKWHEKENFRVFPWVSESDPYKIWISEIMLQQTRAAQAEPYYLNFINAYPTIEVLAHAELEEVLKHWEGLGYYSRCRNLHYTAQDIVFNKGGVFPNTYEDLLTLKGIGPYTAAAIASFAYHLPHAVVDGNVYRVLSRFFGLEWDIAVSRDQKKFSALANELMDKDYPQLFNQSIMDFGATICTPKKTLCFDCPLSAYCVAFQSQEVDLFPVNSKKVKVSHRYFNYWILQYEDKIFIQPRDKADIWQGLYEFYLIETAEFKESIKLDIKEIGNSSPLIWEGKQRLTHRWINARFYFQPLMSIPPQLLNGIWINRQQLKNYAFPKIILDFLKQSEI